VTGLPTLRGDLGIRSGYHSPQVDVDVRLNTNESPFPPPAAFVEELVDAVRGIELNRYPDRAAWDLRVALAGLHRVRPEQVFCANGSNEVIQCVCLAYGGRGRRLVTFEPTYALHAHIGHLSATEVVEVERREDFAIDVAAMEAALDAVRPAITFLCSPNNPTGRSEGAGVVGQVLARAPGLVVVDEAYGQFADWSALSLVSDDRPVAVTRTYSKTWALAGLRLGYLVGPSPVVEALERVALPYHLDSLKQAAGILAVRHTTEMEARVATLVAERERLGAALGRLPVTVWPSQANFILFRPDGRPGGEVWHGLLERSVLVRDCGSWPRLTGCLRVTVGSPDDNTRFLAALRQVLLP
jgi:histidinol-phosphate aminotransferase